MGNRFQHIELSDEIKNKIAQMKKVAGVLEDCFEEFMKITDDLHLKLQIKEYHRNALMDLERCVFMATRGICCTAVKSKKPVKSSPKKPVKSSPKK